MAVTRLLPGTDTGRMTVAMLCRPSASLWIWCDRDRVQASSLWIWCDRQSIELLQRQAKYMYHLITLVSN